MGIANAIITNGDADDAFVRRWTNAPLLVRADTGNFLRERDLHSKASENRFAVWDKLRSQVDFAARKPAMTQWM